LDIVPRASLDPVFAEAAACRAASGQPNCHPTRRQLQTGLDQEKSDAGRQRDGAAAAVRYRPW